MFKRQPSPLVTHRGTRGLPTVSSAIAVLAITGLALGACSAPAAGGAISKQATASWDTHRAKEQQQSVALTSQAFASWDTHRAKEQQQSVALTSQAGPVVIPAGSR